MAEPTIKRGEEHFFVTTYEGNGGGQRVGNFIPFTDSGTIDKSCIFNKGDSPYLEKTYSGNGSRTTWTISFWIKLGKIPSYNSTRGNMLIAYNTGSGAQEDFRFEGGASQQLQWYTHNDGGTGTLADLKTSRTFEDTTKWYHMMFVADRTNATAADRQIIYIDGERVTQYATETYPSQSAEGHIGKSADVHYIGSRAGNSSTRFDGYLAEFNYVDGTALTPSTFGETDTSTGRWVPKTLSGISYGTNGVRLQFANSAGQTIGDDSTLASNDYTVGNLAASDITTDSPTQNHATLHSVIKNQYIQISEGNLKAAQTGGSQGNVVASNMPLSSGKYYCEVTITTAGPTLFLIGVGKESDYRDHYTQDNPLSKIEGAYIRSDTGQGYTTRGDVGAYTSGTYGSSFTTNDVIGFAIDADKGAVWFSKNGTWMNSATASEIADSDVSNALRFEMPGPLVPLQYTHNGTTLTYNFGQKTFAYTPPTGYNSMQQDNLPETSKGKPDIVWIKNRDASDNNQWYDSSRGPLNRLKTNSTDGEDIKTDGLQKFLKGGAAIEDDDEINTSGESYVSWNWVVGGGTTSANTDGVGATVACTIQKNTTAGISIVEWTGGGSAGTIEHGLGKVPQWMMYKRKNADGDGWIIYHHKLNSGSPELGHISLQSTHTFSDDATMWNDTAPTTQLATIGTYGMQNTEKRVGYFFTEIPGFSKFGDFTGNANSDGPSVYLGFKPKFILFKAQTAAHWAIHDSTRDKNQNNQVLYASLTNAESSNSGRGLDFLSNGFKIRMESGYNLNYSGTQTVYFAFAEHPFIGSSSTSPATAR